jgi:hypothetical protein
MCRGPDFVEYDWNPPLNPIEKAHATIKERKDRKDFLTQVVLMRALDTEDPDLIPPKESENMEN